MVVNLVSKAMMKVNSAIKVDFGNNLRLGRGKIRLLELVGETGSISAAARKMNMSYRRAWLLMDELNHMFGRDVIETAAGGSGGGGAHVTAFGLRVIEVFRALENDADMLVQTRIAELMKP
jgi:molybdate transport system regulatory protein